MTKRILHIAGCDKFIPPFIKLIKEKFNFDNHQFLLTSGIADTELINEKNIYLSKRKILSRLKYYFQVVIKMHQVDKVMFHGLFDIRLVIILFFSPWLLKKCYWIIWGGDLYEHKLNYQSQNWNCAMEDFFRRSVIKNIGHLVTYISGDVDLARKWYGATGKYHECLMYSSNLYKDYKAPKKKNNTINIQVGNSADPSNNHLEILEKLLPYKDKDIFIYLPLSYGSSKHAKQVIKIGREWFGSKFNPLTELMPFDEYLVFLGDIDIAIFNHRRQQAMGNTITLLGLGKTVYIRNDTTQWQFFKDKNINIRNIENLTISNVESESESENIDIVKKYFSKDNYLKQLENLLDD